MNDWIVDNLQNAFNTWNDKLAEIWKLLSESPEKFKGGDIWKTIVIINDALKPIGYALLILFLAMSIFKHTMDFRELKRPEVALKHFIRFVAAKTSITYGLDIMTTIFGICNGVVATVADRVGKCTQAVKTPKDVIDKINSASFGESIPLWRVTLLGSIVVTIVSCVMRMTVYNRCFRIYMYTALAPIPLASFAGESTSSSGKAFIKSYIGVCMEGALIVLACLIFSAFSSSPPPVDPNASPITVACSYVAEALFNMIVLVGLVKGADRVAKEMLGL